ncbi:MAG: GNAT family N-acetyltransferase, partial [Candidatus Hermodarchaeota archaeon]
IPIGYLWLNEEENSLWITAIVLKSEYQRHRIGQNIMEFLIVQSQKKGKNYIELGVQRNNRAALQFYSKLGFEQFDFFKSVNTAILRLRLQSP